jgi:hypothetical protein
MYSIHLIFTFYLNIYFTLSKNYFDFESHGMSLVDFTYFDSLNYLLSLFGLEANELSQMFI